MKQRHENKRWEGGRMIRIKPVTEQELAQRGHKRVETYDPKSGFMERVTIPLAPWEQEQQA